MDPERSADPKLTVLMPVYNGEPYVDEAISSVLAQEFQHFEFIIVDDGSSDATPQILQDWASRDRRITILRAPERRGIVCALNYGLENARGEYVVRQDADDICLPGRLARQIAVLDRQKDVILVSANYAIADSDGRPLGTVHVANPPDVIHHLLLFGNVVGGHGQVMFRRDAVLRCGGYRKEFELAEDYDLWARLRHTGRIVIMPVIGMKHRMHRGRLSVLYPAQQRSKGMAVSRGLLQQILSRTLTTNEANAIQSVWAAEGRDGVAADAECIFRAAYDCCATTSPADRRRIRFVTAVHWFNSAVILMRRANLIEAARHLGYAVRWHPGAIATGLNRVAGRSYDRLQRAIRHKIAVAEPRRMMSDNQRSPRRAAASASDIAQP
jgi:hypothetical protein